MVGADELAVEAFTAGAVDGVAIDLSVAINHAVLTGEVFPFGMDVEGVWELFDGTEFAAEVFFIDLEPKLVGVASVVLDPIIDVVVGDAGARAERNLTSMIGEEVESIMVMVFGDGQVAVEHHPVDEVGELAHAASDAFGWFSVGDGESLLITLAFSGATNQFPYREGFPWTNQQSVNMLHSQCEVDRLVLLQLHINIAQSATDEGVVAIDDHGQRVLGALMGKTCLMKRVLQVTLQDLLLCRQSIGERTDLAK